MFKILGMLIKGSCDMNSKYIVDKLTALMKLHSFLIDTAKLVNQNYAIQLLPSVINQFGITLFALFYCYWMVKYYIFDTIY